MRSKFSLIITTLFILLSPTLKAGYAWNLHQIDSSTSNGYALYRYGLPGRWGVKELCNKGIEEVLVLSGNAQEQEWKYKSKCPNLKVIYNAKQEVERPLSAEFLQFFDQWVMKAKMTGKKIAFRCNCGCHRTGRLAAYYQMKYQEIQAPMAITIMNKLGYFMFMYPQLPAQVLALNDFIFNRPCSQAKEFCVIDD